VMKRNGSLVHDMYNVHFFVRLWSLLLNKIDDQLEMDGWLSLIHYVYNVHFFVRLWIRGDAMQCWCVSLAEVVSDRIHRSTQSRVALTRSKASMAEKRG
jgi:hypothetical protein